MKYLKISCCCWWEFLEPKTTINIFKQTICYASAYKIYAQYIKSIFLSKVIAAEGEQKASRALREASDVIAKSSSALQLRYLQVSKWKMEIFCVIIIVNI